MNTNINIAPILRLTLPHFPKHPQITNNDMVHMIHISIVNTRSFIWNNFFKKTVVDFTFARNKNKNKKNKNKNKNLTKKIN